MLERGKDGTSTVKTKVIEVNDGKTLGGIIHRNVKPGSTVYTDEHGGYAGLSHSKFYVHEVINHAQEYVRGRVHTNGIENFWTLLKRAIKGIYVSVEPFHLFRYLDEESFRYNTRKGGDADRFGKVAGGIVGKRLTYKELIGTPTPA